jgi:hypothetical protein
LLNIFQRQHANILAMQVRTRVTTLVVKLWRNVGVAACVLVFAFLIETGCKKNEPIDEAKAAGLTTADFPQVTADIFKPMDGGIDLSPEEIMNRLFSLNGGGIRGVFTVEILQRGSNAARSS